MMITIYFTLQNLDGGEQIPGLPVLYRGRMVGLIKRALELGGNEYKKELYTGHVPKHFSFSVYPEGGYTTEKVKVRIKDNLEVDSNALKSKTGMYKLMISSADPFFTVVLESGFISMKRIQTPFQFSLDNYMTVDGIKLGIKIDRIVLTDRREITDRATFKTLSPLFLRSADNKPVLYDSSAFEKTLNDVMSYRLKALCNRDLLKPLKVEDINMKQKVVQIVEIQDPKPVVKLLCSDGTITLRGHKDDLNLIYRMGLGLKTGYGFGMVEVV